jgi:hypothetical protein
MQEQSGIKVIGQKGNSAYLEFAYFRNSKKALGFRL